VKVRGSLSLDEVIAAAEAIDDPDPATAAELDRQVAAGKIGNREYLVRLGGYCLALAVYDEEPGGG